MRRLLILMTVWFNGVVGFAVVPENKGKSLYFTENGGQWQADILYASRFQHGAVLLQRTGIQYLFVDAGDLAKAIPHPQSFWKSFARPEVRAHAMKLDIIGANEDAFAQPASPMSFYTNYFLGKDSSHWARHLTSYQSVTLNNIYQGIDLHIYSSAKDPLKYDLVLHPGASLQRIALRYNGAESVSLNHRELHIRTSVNTITERSPYAYQIVAGQRVEVPCEFVVSGDTVRFACAAYDHSLPLIIDPTLVFSTYSGSTEDNFGSTATYDSEGNLFAAGITTSVPLTGYPATQGAYKITSSGSSAASWPQVGFACDITISKYNTDGTQLVYATYLGGTKNDYPHSLVVDKDDQLIVMGSTLSQDYPTTGSAYDITPNDSFDIIVTKFNKDGTTLIGSTYVGGSHSDGISLTDTLCMGYMDQMRGEVIVDKNNDIIVGSVTNSFDFPVTSNALQKLKAGRQDGCVFKLNSSLTNMIWATYLGDSNQETLNGIDCDANGNVYVAGGTMSHHTPVIGPVYDSTYHGGFSDAYFAKITSDGSTMLRYKYWGSINYDQAYFVKVHTNGDVYFFSQNFDSVPVTPGVFFNPKGSLNICAFSPGLDSLRMSTRIGNAFKNNVLCPSAFMVDLCGNVYGSVWGGTALNISSYFRTGGWYVNAVSRTDNLPLSSDALQTNTDNNDFYVFELSPTLSTLQFGSYVGEIFGQDHVDGGTSRFDHRGIIYQSFCASCNSGKSGSFPTTPDSWSPTNLSDDCSNASMKLDFRKSNLVIADFTINPKKSCTDSIVKFINTSYHGARFRWYINGVLKDSTFNYADTFRTKGVFTVKLVVVDSLRCNIIDSLSKQFEVQSSSLADFTVVRDTCTAKVLFINKSALNNGSPFPSLWEFGDGNTSTTYNPSHTYPHNGNYLVTLTSNYNSFCKDTAQFLVKYDSLAHQLNARLFAFDTVGCDPANVHVTNIGLNGKQSYWYVNGNLATRTRNFDSVMTKGIYTIKLVVIDSATCIKKDSATIRYRVLPDITPDFQIVRDSCSLNLSLVNTSIIQPGDSVNFTWFFGDGDSSVTQSPVHTFPSPGWYYIQLFANPRQICVKEKSIWYYLDNNKNALIANFHPHDTVACGVGDVLFDNRSFNGSTFWWYINNQKVDSSVNLLHHFDTAGTYSIRLIAIDSASCFKSDTAQYSITLLNHLKPSLTFKRDTCDAGITFFNTTDTTGIGLFPLIWKFGDGDSSQTFQPSHTFPRNATYEVKLISYPHTQCADSTSLFLPYDSVAHILTADFLLNDTALCLPAYLNTTSKSTGATSWKWYLNDVLKDTGNTYTDTLNNPGIYAVKLVVNGQQTCTPIDSLTRTINVYPGGHTEFSISRDSCSLIVQFNNSSQIFTGQQIWLWDFGDGDTSSEKNPTHIYDKGQLYTVKLYSNPGSYCADTSMLELLINGDSAQALFIPNVFTPDNDGKNDCFFIRGVQRDCDKYHIWIRNRWGDLYFESEDPNQCWNGKNEAGTHASEGVYFYILKIKKPKGASVETSGTITLIRD